ncbi:hypothetical protein J1N35_043583 [Gossypium stocksii]|uniref:Uncharacterized protein n=1 Tax=Gossypium stocksii TaxID=47602 RepID=A0A9D3U7J2_9ROSI|nr:hypothetical protein J1N35_043583 [Gossypium stocksii]
MESLQNPIHPKILKTQEVTHLAKMVYPRGVPPKNTGHPLTNSLCSQVTPLGLSHSSMMTILRCGGGYLNFIMAGSSV